ncbi:hypothetical protein ABB37_04959 [Leptomonas pyrrhocoris]|uniref:Uncharacterized protein n=1 Tax=Leptomonas pyrrhocoris TaxID=157538 RepID=A0A0M9G0G9_LEPPY|nr:hypothetical protein ABB37_04959 [Leptomonas pyrrhocoris]KPA79890.1 hypothetical protein ABB37_04959 [Leptomonas pyrrhocoris]|eukprot:XP_015658329.1 hypothetical protein ABB37_04959 [Leptomonas pyrrhocoris]
MEDVREEIRLVATIIDKLLNANESLRADQLTPLTKRLRNAADAITANEGTTFSNAAGFSCSSKPTLNADAGAGVIKLTGSRNNKRAPVTVDTARSSAGKKVSSQKQRPTSAHGEIDTPQLHVSSEVSRSLCCCLYNLLEGAVNLLRASHGHIFVRKGDEMASIANVARKLVFPPQQIHYRCMGNADAEVLGSSIALNRFMEDVGKKGAILIFPIFGRDKSSGQSRVPIATIHVERKDHVFEPFNSSDECILYFASVFCGELMSRVPHFGWLNSFYDPATQHIVAPFVPYKSVPLPGVRRAPNVSSSHTETPGARYDSLPVVVSQLTQKTEEHCKEVLIRRESLPSRNSKPFAPGVTHMPSLLEIQVYVDNLQSCWRKNMTENVNLLETHRSTQQDLKLTRNEMLTARKQLAAANEKLRLYELDSKDYKNEYGALKTELNTYMDKLDRLH